MPRNPTEDLRIKSNRILSQSNAFFTHFLPKSSCATTTQHARRYLIGCGANTQVVYKQIFQHIRFRCCKTKNKQFSKSQRGCVTQTNMAVMLHLMSIYNHFVLSNCWGAVSFNDRRTIRVVSSVTGIRWDQLTGTFSAPKRKNQMEWFVVFHQSIAFTFIRP